MKKFACLIFSLLIFNLNSEQEKNYHKNITDFLKEADAKTISNEASMIELINQSLEQQNEESTHTEKILEQAKQLIKQYEWIQEIISSEDFFPDEKFPKPPEGFPTLEEFTCSDTKILGFISKELQKLILETQSSEETSPQEIKTILKKINVIRDGLIALEKDME